VSSMQALSSIPNLIFAGLALSQLGD